MVSKETASDEVAEATRKMMVESMALLEDDHFVYITGRHGAGWIDMSAIYPHTMKIETLCGWLGDLVADLKFDYVCGPAIGGLMISVWTAHRLGAPALFAEHDPNKRPGEVGGKFILRRGFDQKVCGKTVLVVDDVVNTGHSIRQTIEAVRVASGVVPVAATLIHRGSATRENLGVDEYRRLLDFPIPDWSADECPMCKSNKPVNVRYAHGQEFVAGADRPVDDAAPK